MRVVSQTLDATRFAFSRIETKIQENVSLFRFAQIKIRFTDSLFCFFAFLLWRLSVSHWFSADAILFLPIAGS